jgi:hypothetical protein
VIDEDEEGNYSFDNPRKSTRMTTKTQKKNKSLDDGEQPMEEEPVN